MVSASKEKRLAKQAAEGKGKKTVASRSKAGSKNASAAGSVNGDETPPQQFDANGNPIEADEPATSSSKMGEVQRLAEQMDKYGISDRVTTGVLSSVASSRDVKITSVSLVFHGRVLITDSTLELNFGRRYGLLGENGCGKSTLLKAIAAREYPIPEHVDIYLLNEGAPPSDLGALEWVVKEAENEMARLENKAEELLETEGPDSQVLMDLYDVRFHFTTPRPSSPLPPSGSLPAHPADDWAWLVTDIPVTLAHGQDGPLDLCHPCFAHPDRSGLQQDHHPQEDKGHVWWLEDACRPRKGPVCQAHPPTS